MENDLCVVNSLQSIQIFDTVLSPWYLPEVLVALGGDPDCGIWSSGSRALQGCRRSSGNVRFPDGAAPVRTCTIRSNFSRISGEIENTKTNALTVHRAKTPGW